MQCSHKKQIVSLVLLVAAGTFFSPALAIENAAATVEPSRLPGMEQDLQKYEYQLEGRKDPFVPFISDKAATQKMGGDDIVDDDVTLTGMQLFEPGQLTLVAVIASGNRKIAMVEDVTGKGYVLTEGMPIGRRGIINSIDADQVTVIETAHTRAGRKIETTVFMRLNKEGDK